MAVSAIIMMSRLARTSLRLTCGIILVAVAISVLIRFGV